ncbi:hypothetical protein PoB_001502600 [Plakobranchus ocellatus]|uniref:Uncharacterized protein n=1 Tax=Plakobranchus ocellatus TaxID=259542 RepID=A0AAV3YMP7_9GAST|nr:hypothetical protein PoB_001502600 [Plakobranchus ocellatus]
MASPFPLSDRASDVRPGCKTQRIAPSLRQVADLMCARMEKSEYFKTCIVGHVNCCLQCGPTLTVLCSPTSKPYNMRNKTGLVLRSRIMRGHVIAPPTPFLLSDRGTDVRPGCKTQGIAPVLPIIRISADFGSYELSAVFRSGKYFPHSREREKVRRKWLAK